MDIIKTHSHSLITIALMLISLAFGLELYISLLLIGYWSGREYSQAEYRYMKLKGINRSKLGFFDGFRLEAWNRDSFLNDFVLPIAIGTIIVIGFIYWWS